MKVNRVYYLIPFVVVFGLVHSLPMVVVVALLTLIKGSI